MQGSCGGHSDTNENNEVSAFETESGPTPRPNFFSYRKVFVNQVKKSFPVCGAPPSACTVDLEREIGIAGGYQSQHQALDITPVPQKYAVNLESGVLYFEGVWIQGYVTAINQNPQDVLLIINDGTGSIIVEGMYKIFEKNQFLKRTFPTGTYVMVTGRPTQISQSSVTIKASRIAELSATEEFAWESEVMDIQLRIMEKY